MAHLQHQRHPSQRWVPKQRWHANYRAEEAVGKKEVRVKKRQGGRRMTVPERGWRGGLREYPGQEDEAGTTALLMQQQQQQQQQQQKWHQQSNSAANPLDERLTRTERALEEELSRLDSELRNVKRQAQKQQRRKPKAKANASRHSKGSGSEGAVPAAGVAAPHYMQPTESSFRKVSEDLDDDLEPSTVTEYVLLPLGCVCACARVRVRVYPTVQMYTCPTSDRSYRGSGMAMMDAIRNRNIVGLAYGESTTFPMAHHAVKGNGHGTWTFFARDSIFLYLYRSLSIPLSLYLPLPLPLFL